MLENFIKPGQRVDLKAVRRVKVSGEETKEKVYSTKIYDIVSEDTIELVMPMEQTKLILLPVDGEYEIFFYTDNGLYESTIRITDRYKSNNVYILLVELQTNLRKYQRRDFYRYSCALDMETRELTSDEAVAYRKGEIYQAPPGLPSTKAVIVDISGGGMRFTSKAVYEKDGLIWFLEACDLNVLSIRRALWQLDQAGWFRTARGFLIGRPYLYGEEIMGLDQYRAVTDILGSYGVPIVMDADLGHHPPMMPIISGSMGSLITQGNNLKLTMKLV